MSRASAILQRDVDRTRRQTEERCKEQYLEEMKKVAQKHKTEVSAAKKKQWVSEGVEHVINPYSAGIDFSRQNLTSVDIKFWWLKSIPAL